MLEFSDGSLQVKIIAAQISPNLFAVAALFSQYRQKMRLKLKLVDVLCDIC